MASPPKRAYKKKYYAEFQVEHGVSYSAKYRADNPEEKQRHRERESARYQEQKEHIRQVQAAYTLLVKRQCFEAYGGVHCACCGEKTFEFLTLDHIDNDGAAHRLALSGTNRPVGGKRFYRILKAREFPKLPRLQVLCFNCNCGKQVNKGVCPHRKRRRDDLSRCA